MIKVEKGQNDEKIAKKFLGMKVEKKTISFLLLLLLFNYAQCYILAILLHVMTRKMKLSWHHLTKNNLQHIIREFEFQTTGERQEEKLSLSSSDNVTNSITV